MTKKTKKPGKYENHTLLSKGSIFSITHNNIEIKLKQ